MKRPKLVFLLSFMAVALMTSCNKKLKDDLDELEKSVEEQKAQNSALQGEVDNLNNLLFNAPISFSFATNNGTSNVSASGSYSFVYGSANNYSFVHDNGNGTYRVYFWRGNDLGTDYSVEVDFVYNPTTNTVTNASASHDGFFSNGDSYSGYFSGASEITQTISVSAFNYANGTITFSYSATTTSAYGDNVYSNQGMTFSANYSGGFSKNQYSNTRTASGIE